MIKRKQLVSRKNWLIFSALLSLSLLALAHYFEYFEGLSPCPLCLKQRGVYWVAFSLALLGFVTHIFLKVSWRKIQNIIFCLALGLTFLTGSLIAGYHTGVEQGWFPAPLACQANRVDLTKISKNLKSTLSKPVKPPSCTEITWRFLGFSMAVWNMIISLLLSFTSFILCWRKQKEQ